MMHAWARTVGLGLLLLLAPRASAGEPLSLPPLPAPASEGYLRVVDDGANEVGLDIATRQFVRGEGKGPRVALVAVAHIGEQRFYRELQEQLDGYDVVLYESVLPPGARGPGGETDEQRAESTRIAMQFVAGLVESFADRRGTYPVDLAALRDHLAGMDDRLPAWQLAASTDAWGRPVRYVALRDDQSRVTGYRMTSLGADGAPGGDGVAADVVITSSDGLPAIDLESGDNLQAKLAATLGLSFQLDAIDYDRSTWRCSDMAMDEVARALADRGIEFQPLAGALTGSSLPAKVVGFLLRLVRMADTFLGGVIADTCKVALIELLGNEDLMEQSLDQMGEGFAEVIVGMRNQVAVDDLEHLIADEPDVETVAIFYGAAHMPDLEQRLGTLGYIPVVAGERWHRAIEVDLAQSQVTRRDLEQMRMMMRRMAGMGN